MCAAAALPAGVRRPLLLTFGTRGDVQPFVPLALEMQARVTSGSSFLPPSLHLRLEPSPAFSLVISRVGLP